jgi:D-alanine-D-alanine ligase
MKVTLLHNADALEPPEDPVLGQLTSAIESFGHEVDRLPAGNKVAPIVAQLESFQPDLVFNLIESFNDKSALGSNVTALLNLLGLRYTGSSPGGMIIADDKSVTKKILRFHGIQTPEFATLYRGAVDWAGDLEFPVIVKPPQEDASIGISSSSVVHGIKDLFARIDELQSEYQSPVLVEQFIEGREFYVGLLGNVNVEALPIVELDFSKFPTDKPRIASWEAKWGDESGGGAEFAGTESVFPEGLDEQLAERMQKVAKDCFQALRLRDYARIDMRVTDAGEIFVIEVNPNCYLEKDSEFARAARRSGLEYDLLIGRILELAAARYSR